MKNEQPLIDIDNLLLTDELVSAYLQDNPEFFNRNNELMTGLRLTDARRGTVSLVEKQQQQLRQKIDDLEDEITQLMSIANQNKSLFELYNDLYLHLIDSKSLTDLLDCLAQKMTQILSLSAVKLYLTNPIEIEHKSLINTDCQEVIANRLATSEYYFGRLQQDEQELIFSHTCTGSVVLVRLTYENNELGFLAISSDDAHHFDPRMDTLFLGQFKSLVSKLLYQYLAL